MADFPTVKHTFTTFSNGATTDAAQVTDIYAEVEAIEDGYLNATARLNSSNSTLANLSVPGGSTLTTLSAGASTLTTLQVTGNSTFTGTVTITGTLTASALAPHPFALATGSTSQFANGSSGGVSWPTNTSLNNSSVHSTGTNPDRFFPQSTGLWALSVSVTLAGAFADPSTGVIDLNVKDSSGTAVSFMRTNGSAGGRAPSASVTGMKHFDSLAATPYLRLTLLQRSGSTASLDGSLSFARFYRV
jgi:hypothetical protein